MNEIVSIIDKRAAKAAVLFSLLLIAIPLAVNGQSYRTGQHIYPAFEGWRPNPDGSSNFMFGYMNENWEEEPFAPVGENNYFSPGEADRGQPTHFLPRRNRFTFEVTVPADWGDRELVWTLNVNGVERKAYATLRQDYLVDNMVIASETGSLGAGLSSPESRANIPPVITLQGDSVRVGQVGNPIELQVHVWDDGIPSRTNISASDGFIAPDAEAEATEEFITSRLLGDNDVSRPPRRVTVGKVNGLYMSWNLYRGDGSLVIDPPLPKVWEDTRTSANSPWGPLWSAPEIPDDGIYNATVTFDRPGTYVLWGRADDGGLYDDTYVTVRVSE